MPAPVRDVKSANGLQTSAYVGCSQCVRVACGYGITKSSNVLVSKSKGLVEVIAVDDTIIWQWNHLAVKSGPGCRVEQAG